MFYNGDDDGDGNDGTPDYGTPDNDHSATSDTSSVVSEDDSVTEGGGRNGYGRGRKLGASKKPDAPQTTPKPKAQQTPKPKTPEASKSDKTTEPNDKKKGIIGAIFDVVSEFVFGSESSFDVDKFKQNFINVANFVIDPDEWQQQWNKFKKEVLDKNRISNEEFLVSNVFVVENGFALVTPDMAIMFTVVGGALVIAAYALDSIVTTNQDLPNLPTNKKLITAVQASLEGGEEEALKAALGGLGEKLQEEKKEIDYKKARKQAKSEHEGLATGISAKREKRGDAKVSVATDTTELKNGGRF
jgi:hypothetical protein